MAWIPVNWNRSRSTLNPRLNRLFPHAENLLVGDVWRPGHEIVVSKHLGGGQYRVEYGNSWVTLQPLNLPRGLIDNPAVTHAKGARFGAIIPPGLANQVPDVVEWRVRVKGGELMPDGSVVLGHGDIGRGRKVPVGMFPGAWRLRFDVVLDGDRLICDTRRAKAQGRGVNFDPDTIYRTGRSYSSAFSATGTDQQAKWDAVHDATSGSTSTDYFYTFVQKAVFPASPFSLGRSASLFALPDVDVSSASFHVGEYEGFPPTLTSPYAGWASDLDGTAGKTYDHDNMYGYALQGCLNHGWGVMDDDGDSWSIDFTSDWQRGSAYFCPVVIDGSYDQPDSVPPNGTNQEFPTEISELSPWIQYEEAASETILDYERTHRGVGRGANRGAA